MLKDFIFRLKALASRLKHQEGNTGMPPSLPYATE